MIRLSCDDGCASDVRVAELAKKYNVECIFYWPVEWHSLAYSKGYEPLTLGEAQLISKDFEIGGHTITHRHLTAIPEDQAKREVAESGVMLSRLFNTEIYKFCPPRGYTNEELTEYTLSIYNSQRLTKGENLVHIHPNSGANGNIDWRLASAQKAALLENRAEDIELWCHSWELDKYDLWEELESFLKEYHEGR